MQQVTKEEFYEFIGTGWDIITSDISVPRWPGNHTHSFCERGKPSIVVAKVEDIANMIPGEDLRISNYYIVKSTKNRL